MCCICTSVSVITCLISSHYNVGPCHPQQEINTNHPINISLQSQKSKGRSNTTLKPGKRRPHVEKVRGEKMMKRQRNTTEMKKQGRNSQDQINEEEISNLPEREYWTKIVKMLQRLENRMERLQEAFNTVNTITKSIEEINNKQTEMNNTVTEIKSSLLLLLGHISRVWLCATP